MVDRLKNGNIIFPVFIVYYYIIRFSVRDDIIYHSYRLFVHQIRNTSTLLKFCCNLQS